MSGTDGGDTNHTPAPAEENRGSLNDAPGAPSATPGPVEASGQTPGHQAPPGSEQLTTEETRAEAVDAGEPAESGEGADRMHGCPVTDSLGATVVHCNRDDYLGLCRALKADGYVMPIGLTGVDYLTHPGRVLPDGVRAERFEVVVELLDLVRHRRIRVRCQVPVSDPSLPSLYDLWPGTDFHERETYDMFGIRFEGHPDLSRILMPEDWEGHPLRKDYDTGHVPVQFKEAPRGATI